MKFDLTGKLKVGDEVLEVFHQHTEKSYKRGFVEKLTKTRATVKYKRDDSWYKREFTLKNGEIYPRSRDYAYTHIEPMTSENKTIFDEYIRRKQLEYSIFKSREVIDTRHNLRDLSLEKLKKLDDAFKQVAELLKEIRNERS